MFGANSKTECWEKGSKNPARWPGYWLFCGAGAGAGAGWVISTGFK